MELAEIEAKRQQLEENMATIRKSLKLWQSWDAQYESLKEELIAAEPEQFDAATLLSTTKDSISDLLTKKEILDLAGLSATTPPRSRRQILGLIARRQEYVQKNIETLQRRYFVAEGKLEEFAFASMTVSGVYGDGAGEVDEGGLPLTEICEELDEEGNVVSSELRRPEEGAGVVVEKLKQAGLSAKDLGIEEERAPVKPALVTPLPSPTKLPAKMGEPFAEHGMNPGSSEDEDAGPRRPPIRKKSVSFSADTKAAEEKAIPESHEGRKSVSFAEKVAIARAADPPDNRSVKFSTEVEEIPPPPTGPPSPLVHAATDPVAPEVTPTPVNADLSRQADLRASFKPGDRVYEIDEDAEITKPHFVLPANESEADARIRREMLNYHLNEVNNVVAQMDIDGDYDDDDDEEDLHDDGHSVFTASENQDDYASNTSGLSDWEADDDDVEDEFGRSTGDISDEYRKEMQALQERLIGNLGSAPRDEDIEDLDPELDPADVRKLVIRDRRSSVAETQSGSDAENKSSSKKRVSFAEQLDVQEQPVKAQKHMEGESVLALSDTVLERGTKSMQATPGATAAAKTSRFKQAITAPPSVETPTSSQDLDDSMADAPTGPMGKTLADILVERPPSSLPVSAPDLDEHDAISSRRELATEYYRRRNDIIREQGGFKVDLEQEGTAGELMEEKDGKMKKVSRFKAARIGR